MSAEYKIKKLIRKEARINFKTQTAILAKDVIKKNSILILRLKILIVSNIGTIIISIGVIVWQLKTH